uniref:MATE family efflux transporter n=1 Tax=Ningiella ruwaisensis TaxID=2364274 RepID=UPI00109F4E86|nr:MATE family efflux transporter [Ningiella ruwaisensis]
MILLAKPQAHRALLSIAFPLILANITTPILGLVDTAILGRMDGIHYLAGAAIASLILTQLYWICGFLKMSLTGLSAQSKSKSDDERLRVLMQGVYLAFVLACLILLFQSPVLQAGLWFAKAQIAVEQASEAYFYVRVWGAPAALINLAIVGWLIGQQQGRLILLLQVFVNVLNIIASLIFVYVFDWGVQGVAAGTVLAEYSLLLVSLVYINKALVRLYLRRVWLNFTGLKPLLSLNSNILIRNLALQFTLAFVTLKGAQYGAQAAAINAILMQFFALIALGLDGIANAVEALVGEKAGEKAGEKTDKVHSIFPMQTHPNENAVVKQVQLGILYSTLVAIIYSVIFFVFGSAIIRLLSDQAVLLDAMQAYTWIIILLPLIAHWCFLFDGVYVGLTQGKTMRNNMLISTFFGFLPVYYLLESTTNLENQAIWLAMFSFLAFRGFGLAWHFVRVLAPKYN